MYSSLAVETVIAVVKEVFSQSNVTVAHILQKDEGPNLDKWLRKQCSVLWSLVPTLQFL